MVNSLSKFWRNYSLFITLGAIAGLALGLVLNAVDISNPFLLRLVEYDKKYYSFLLPLIGSLIGIIVNYFKERR